jgi:class 3 adenylate cyclase
MTSDRPSALRTFLIADIRGYTRYTEEYGDEAAARLADEFAALVADGVEAHDGKLVQLRGDEALAVFTSARQAIRAAVDLQGRFGDETGASSEIPLKVA